MDALLCSLGHVATSRQLAARNVTPAALRLAVQRGRVIRLRRGVYGCTHLDRSMARAARIGGAVSCVSLLGAHGVWAGHSGQLHLQVPPHSSVTATSGTRIHWETPRFGMHSQWQASRMQALWQAIRCLDAENALAALESAVHEEFLTWEQVQQVVSIAPRRLQSIIRRMIPNSGSGNETIVRMRVEDAGYHVEPQGYVPGMGHQDLVIEGCVGLDVDGRKWHESDDRFAIDRDRDVHVEGLGRHVLRIRTAHIFRTWPHTLAVIDRVVMDARREQQRRFGRVIVRADDPL